MVGQLGNKLQLFVVELPRMICQNAAFLLPAQAKLSRLAWCMRDVRARPSLQGRMALKACPYCADCVAMHRRRRTVCTSPPCSCVLISDNLGTDTIAQRIFRAGLEPSEPSTVGLALDPAPHHRSSQVEGAKASNLCIGGVLSAVAMSCANERQLPLRQLTSLTGLSAAASSMKHGPNH